MPPSDQQYQSGFDHPPTFRAAVALAAHKADQSAEVLADQVIDHLRLAGIIGSAGEPLNDFSI